MFRPYVPFDPPCSGGSMPGTRNLAQALTEAFNKSISMGIYNCRPPSTHGDGRAYDMGFRKVNGLPEPQGYIALAILRLKAWDLGITELIWDDLRYSAKYPDGRVYEGPSDHTDHIHIGQTPEIAASLSLDTARDLLSSGDMALTAQEETFVKEMYAAAQSLSPVTNGSFVAVLVKWYRAIKEASK